MRIRSGIRTAVVVTVTLSFLNGPVTSPAGAGGGGEPQPGQTEEVCFTVHNPGDPEPSAVYGVRYAGDRPDAPAIVLVHGVSPAHEYWDLRPDYSVARNLAAAGYTVFSYDRLGWGRSPYRRPGGGYRLSMTAAQDMLHEIVGQVKAGTYTTPSGGECPVGSDAPAGPAIPKVVVMGASAGGAVVSGYPGRFHDVDAAVPMVFSNQGTSADFTPWFAGSMARGSATGQDYYRVVPDEASCRRYVLHPPGVHQAFEPGICRHGFGAAAPAGEVDSLGRLVAENLVSITRTGPGIPVLLAFADRDALFPPDHPTAEFNYWKTHCGCDVEAWTAPNTGHGLAVHTSMPAFTDEVTRWLAAKGLQAAS